MNRTLSCLLSLAMVTTITYTSTLASTSLHKLSLPNTRIEESGQRSSISRSWSAIKNSSWSGSSSGMGRRSWLLVRIQPSSSFTRSLDQFQCNDLGLIWGQVISAAFNLEAKGQGGSSELEPVKNFGKLVSISFSLFLVQLCMLKLQSIT